VRADMVRANFTRKERERLNLQQDIEIADLNHNQILAQKVQSCHNACVRGDHRCMDTPDAGNGYSSIRAQVSEPQLHNLLDCASDVVECPSDVLGSKL